MMFLCTTRSSPRYSSRHPFIKATLVLSTEARRHAESASFIRLPPPLHPPRPTRPRHHGAAGVLCWAPPQPQPYAAKQSPDPAPAGSLEAEQHGEVAEAGGLLCPPPLPQVGTPRKSVLQAVPVRRAHGRAAASGGRQQAPMLCHGNPRRCRALRLRWFLGFAEFPASAARGRARSITGSVERLWDGACLLPRGGGQQTLDGMSSQGSRVYQ